MKTKDRQGNIGLMKQRVQFQYYSLTSDGMGGNTQEWNNLVTVWAKVAAFSGYESYEVGGLKGKVKYRITTRYRDDFISQGYSRATYDYLLRAIYDGRTFNIEYARDKGENQGYTELIAVEEIDA
jgi:SPP1 family predicted phage head-tail adaptor